MLICSSIGDLASAVVDVVNTSIFRAGQEIPKLRAGDSGSTSVSVAFIGGQEPANFCVSLCSSKKLKGRGYGEHTRKPQCRAFSKDYRDGFANKRYTNPEHLVR